MFERKSIVEKDVLFDLLNRIAHCFVRAAGIGALQALSKEAYFTALQGMVAGVYSGLTYGLKEARGVHEWVPIIIKWKNNALAGALTGGALALTLDHTSHEKIVQCVITGAALSTAANILAGVL
ncbi:outer envelope pore protein 16-2, chloroplastic-like isoform X1 [Salvia miltiorrhiza]|uniref:outer envelope pore protein 16-2, chloroplastic-like isoform X1 n=1 Tax=Salvia miltiorrhiza TaxID=226208 RepID=UPI0025ABFDC7|nr:outer envelope pore protein 16-2, chloroplastic-like isoform X1 [Salvia miltiorrhiza]